jgi:hypothetical protein
MNVNSFDDDLIDDDFINIGDGDMDLFEMDILDVLMILT